MTFCTTTVHGSGLNTNGCGPIGNYGDYTFNGRATLVAITYLGCGGLQLYLDGISQGNSYIFYTDAYIVSTTCDPLPTTYDCINGTCVASSKYTTSGLYQSLADCQAVCANGGACAEGKQCIDPNTFTPPGKVCLDQGEFDSIEALISKIGSEVC